MQYVQEFSTKHQFKIDQDLFIKFLIRMRLNHDKCGTNRKYVVHIKRTTFNGDHNEKKKSALNLPKGNETFTTCSLYY